MSVEVFVEVCREDAILPRYANPGDAGMDVYACEEITIRPGETVIVPTGLKLAIPEGYEIQVRPRSGLSFKTPLRIPNSPGTIDSGYRDELGIIVNNTSEAGWANNSGADLPNTSEAGLINTSEVDALNNSEVSSPSHCEGPFTLDEKGNKKGTYIIRKGDRIAQIVLQVVPKMVLTRVEAVKHIGNDRGGGFGSTGVG